MLQHQTFLQCSRQTATIVILTIFSLFLVIGCASMLRKVGLAPNEADQVAADAQTTMAGAAAEAVADIQTGLAQGKPLQAIALETGSTFAWKLATIAASTIGIVLTGLLAKWLDTERKITDTLITSIENNDSGTLKEIIHNRATTRGVERRLHRRVQALT